MPKISVIIPVYNVEKYIHRCLDSVFSQTLKEIEIIIINDGSTDKTEKIMNQYIEKYPDKIIKIDKENEGQGKARNIGIDIAQGDFITFVDGDDVIAPNMLQDMYDLAIKDEADIVLCDYYEIREDTMFTKKAIPIRTNHIEKDYIVSVAGPCGKLIHTTMLKDSGLRFLENRIYEDLAMVPLMAIYANQISYLEKPLYYYHIRQGSTMRQNTFNDKLLSIYPVLDTLKNGFGKVDKEKKYREELEFIYIRHLLYAGNGRFLEYSEGKKQVKKIYDIMKLQYPQWRKNKYYKKQNLTFRITCNIYYSNCLFVIMVFQQLKRYIKRG